MAGTAPQRSPAVQIAAFLLCQALVFAVAGAGAWFTAQGLTDWYPALEKPALTPPDWVFPVVWNILFFLMGLSLWLVWRATDFGSFLTGPAAPFVAQLAINLAWSNFFFNLHRLGWAVADVFLLLAAIALTIFWFRRYSRLAAALLVPYFLWVAFAAYLTVTIWRLNG